MKKIILFALFFSPILLIAEEADLTGAQILNKIDDNKVVIEAISTSTMIIHSRSGTREIKSRSWVKGKNKVFTEYLSPKREKGKKMLRVGDKLWNYTPFPSDRIITISGHLLRQSIMGSDLSYEDFMQNEKLIDQYDAKIIGEEKMEVPDLNKTLVGTILKLKLTAKKDNVSYHSRLLWVNKEKWLPIKEELYAKSGKLLKTIKIEEVMKVDDRFYPQKIVFKDELGKGKGTVWIVESIKFNQKIPDYKFTKAALKK
ncbi:MAG: outer membrane lipoprotein-sorting protein [Pseudomonadota bacterium]